MPKEEHPKLTPGEQRSESLIMQISQNERRAQSKEDQAAKTRNEGERRRLLLEVKCIRVYNKGLEDRLHKQDLVNEAAADRKTRP